MDIYNKQEETPNIIYESYNNLVFSNDKKVLFKMITKINLYKKIKHLNGDIMEFGVFMGAGIALWLQLLKLYEIHSSTMVIGFDFFDKNDLLKNLKGDNKNMMSQVINRGNDKNSIQLDVIKRKCSFILPNRFILIKGDACITSLEFKKNNKGERIKLLYLDMDLEEPTFQVLNNLWDRVVINGLIILDEYGFHKWDESNGVDRFLKTIKGKYKLLNTNVQNPTMIIEKIDF